MIWLGKCIDKWPEDGRAYVALGKMLSKQMKAADARAVYERGCQATQGENSYIWQVSLNPAFYEPKVISLVFPDGSNNKLLIEG